MKILFFIHRMSGGGAERVASVLLNHFCEKHETYLAFTSESNNQYHIDKRIKLIHCKAESWIKGFHRILRYGKYFRAIREVNPDVIISFIVQTNGIVLLTNLLTHKKLIVSERNSTQYNNNILKKIIRGFLYPLATRVVFVAKEECDNSSLKNKTFIHNPKHIENYDFYEKRSKSIISIGPQHKWHQKGFDLLIKAWASIESEYPDWILEILGLDDDPTIHKLITKLGINHRVSFLGWSNDVVSVLREKSIYVLSSRYEGFPNSLVEAMSQGCACIAADCHTGPKEIITNNVSGLLIPTENIDELANTLKKLISDEELRHRLSAGAVIETNRFDKNKILQQWDALIEEVANN